MPPGGGTTTLRPHEQTGQKQCGRRTRHGGPRNGCRLTCDCLQYYENRCRSRLNISMLGGPGRCGEYLLSAQGGWDIAEREKFRVTNGVIVTIQTQNFLSQLRAVTSTYLPPANTSCRPRSTCRKCLSKLREVCDEGVILPKTYTLLSGNPEMEPNPFASGRSGDVYLGPSTVQGFASNVCEGIARMSYRRTQRCDF